MATATINPNGNSTPIELLPSSGANWECVSSLHQSEPDDAATFVINDTEDPPASSRLDLYALESNSIGPDDTINSVTIYFRCFKCFFFSGSSCSATPHIKTHGVDYGGITKTLTTTWTTFSQAWTTNPNTGLAWTKAEIDALIAGISLYNSKGQRAMGECTWVYIVVDYTPAAAPSKMMVQVI